MATKSTSIPAAPVIEQAIEVIEQEAPLSFFAQLTTLATPITDLSEVATKRDPLISARTKFAVNCDETIKLIKSAAESAKFFRKLPDGYLINFRNGNRSMELNGAAYFKVADAIAATVFVNVVVASPHATCRSSSGRIRSGFSQT